MNPPKLKINNFQGDCSFVIDAKCKVCAGECFVQHLWKDSCNFWERIQPVERNNTRCWKIFHICLMWTILSVAQRRNPNLTVKIPRPAIALLRLPRWHSCPIHAHSGYTGAKVDLFRRLQISALPMGFLLIFKRNLGTSYFKKVSRNPLKRSEGWDIQWHWTEKLETSCL